jgi:hypothetical protein
MSLCNRCGLDLDTGQRHVLEELFEEPPTPKRASGPPMGILVVGGLALAASLAAGVVAIGFSLQEGASQLGYLALAAVAFFGVYAAVQFLRGRSARLIVLTLLLGAAIDVVALIAMPIYAANNPQQVEFGPILALPGDEGAPQVEGVAQRFAQQWWKIKWGIGLLLFDAGALIYLTTPGVRRHFERGHHSRFVPVG